VSVEGASTRAVDGLLDFTVPLDRLPYGLRLERAEVGPAGVLLSASSGPTVITPP
jgi:hypothetical protein